MVGLPSIKLPSTPKFGRQASAASETTSSPAQSPPTDTPPTDEQPTNGEATAEPQSKKSRLPSINLPSVPSFIKRGSSQSNGAAQSEEQSADTPADEAAAEASKGWYLKVLATPEFAKRAAAAVGTPISPESGPTLSDAALATEAPPVVESATQIPTSVSLKKGHTVYLVMQPVISAAEAVFDLQHQTAEKNSMLAIAAKIRSAIQQYFKGMLEFGELMGLLVAQHWGVHVEEHYYHLKRMPDNSLALDMTPFNEEAVFLKIPLWKTRLSHEDRGGIAVRILKTMMNTSDEPDLVRVEKGGNIVERHGFLYIKYRVLSYSLKFGKTGYSALFNNCQHFVYRYFDQIFVPSGVKDVLDWPAIVKELWLPRVSADDLKKIMAMMKADEFSISFLLECILKKGAAAAVSDVSKTAASMVEFVGVAKKEAKIAEDEVEEVIKAMEAATEAAAAINPQEMDTEEAEKLAQDAVNKAEEAEQHARDAVEAAQRVVEKAVAAKAAAKIYLVNIKSARKMKKEVLPDSPKSP